MAVTATTMLAALAAIFLSFVLCFYICLCAKRSSRGAAPPPPAGGGVLAHLRFLFGIGAAGGTSSSAEAGAVASWCYEGGLDDASMASLPTREVSKGDEEAMDCAVCLTELAAGETARVLPRCGHAFHVGCVDMWLTSHSTCPLCRCPAVDHPPKPPPVHTPEADPDSPNFPTNVLFFGSQDDVTTGGTARPPTPPPQALQASRGLRRLLGCGGAAPPPHTQEDDAVRDIEMGIPGGESTSASRQPKSPRPGSS